jgi:hypothetical protein
VSESLAFLAYFTCANLALSSALLCAVQSFYFGCIISPFAAAEARSPSTQRLLHARCSRLTARYAIHSLYIRRFLFPGFLIVLLRAVLLCSSYSYSLVGFSHEAVQPLPASYSQHSRRGHRHTSRGLKRGDRIFVSGWFVRVFCLFSATSVHRFFHTIRTLRSVSGSRNSKRFNMGDMCILLIFIVECGATKQLLKYVKNPRSALSLTLISAPFCLASPLPQMCRASHRFVPNVFSTYLPSYLLN